MNVILSSQVKVLFLNTLIVKTTTYTLVGPCTNYKKNTVQGIKHKRDLTLTIVKTWGTHT